MAKLSPEVRRVSESLGEAIRRRRTSQQVVERAMGLSKGYLSQLLNGNVDLRMKHIFHVLEVLKLEPADFFLEVYDRRNASGSMGGLVSRAEVKEDIEELKKRVARLERLDREASSGA
jgi:transcriptional regulator with XRE-family HTH domain